MSELSEAAKKVEMEIKRSRLHIEQRSSAGGGKGHIGGHLVIYFYAFILLQSR